MSEIKKRPRGKKRALATLPPDWADPAAQDRLDEVGLVAASLGTGVSTIWRYVATGQIAKPIKVGRLSKWTRRYIRRLTVDGVPPAATA